jgi:Zn-dependent protease
MVNLLEIFGGIVIVLFSIIIHECAHGFVANLLGDPTAKDQGRLTLNPLKHIDPFGTIILPGILIILKAMGLNTFVFGWAKPVPVTYARLNHPKTDMILVALAGPLSNILIAIAFVGGLHYPQLNLTVLELFHLGVFVNLLLAVFNMLPVPPLDGSRLIAGLMPNRLAVSYGRLEPYGILIVMILLSAGLIDKIIFPIIEMLGRLLGVSLQ